MRPPIRVLHVLPDLDVGGGQLLCLENIRAMDRERFVHAVAHVAPPCALRARFEAAGVTVLDLGVRARSDWPLAFRRIHRFAQGWGADLIHGNNTQADVRFAAPLARARRTPLVNSLHAAVPQDYDPGAPRRFLDALARPRLSHLVAVSATVRTSWLPQLARLGLDPSRLTTISPGLNVRAFPPPRSARPRADLRREIGVPDDTPILICVARLVEGKGHTVLIEAMSHIARSRPGATLVLVGEGPLRPSIEAQIRAARLGSAVRLLGQRHDVAHVLAGADMFLFGSAHEGFGIAPLEAMAAGLPVVAFALPSLRDFIRNGVTGTLVPHGHAETLASAALSLLADPAKAAAMGRAGRVVVDECYSTSSVGARLGKLYRSALNPPARERLVSPQSQRQRSAR